MAYKPPTGNPPDYVQPPPQAHYDAGPVTGPVTNNDPRGDANNGYYGSPAPYQGGQNQGYYGGDAPYGQPGYGQQPQTTWGPGGPGYQQPQQGMPYQQPYGQPGMAYQPQNPYGPGPYGQPGPGYYGPGNRGAGGAGAEGCCAGLMAALACCCCLELLF